jgi:hypothetical protein
MSKPKNSGEFFKHVVYTFYSFSQYQQGFWGQKAVYEYYILINRSCVHMCSKM